MLEIVAPPLRDRLEDLPALVASLLQRLSKKNRKDIRGISPEALKALGAKAVQGRYTGFPSNVDDLIRELPEHIERKLSDQTVILDDKAASKGDWNI